MEIVRIGLRCCNKVRRIAVRAQLGAWSGLGAQPHWGGGSRWPSGRDKKWAQIRLFPKQWPKLQRKKKEKVLFSWNYHTPFLWQATEFHWYQYLARDGSTWFGDVFYGARGQCCPGGPGRCVCGCGRGTWGERLFLRGVGAKGGVQFLFFRSFLLVLEKLSFWGGRLGTGL